MRRLKPVSLKVKNIGGDGRKKTVEIPLKVDSHRAKEPLDSSEIINQNENPSRTSSEQDVPWTGEDL